jgi:hypothetical protein
MLPHNSAHAAGADEAPPATSIASLPHALLARVLARLPVDDRLRAAEVCRGWRTVVETERSLWTTLDFSDSSGVTHEVTKELLRAAAGKAGGALETMDLCGCFWWSWYDALLEVVTDNAASLRELRAYGSAFEIDSMSCETAEDLLRAAPQLRELVTDVECYTVEDAVRVLRKEGMFQRLHVIELHAHVEEADGAEMHELAAALATHTSPLACLHLRRAPLTAPDVLDAVVDAALANQLTTCYFEACHLFSVSVPSLVRLLGSGALKRLLIDGNGAQLLDAPAAALLGGALRTNGVLAWLKLENVRLWDDSAAATMLLSSLVAHPSLRELMISGDAVPPAYAACAGTALFALVAANAPALEHLSVGSWQLGDAGLRPLMDALPRNMHLMELYLSGNDITDAFARDVLLPAVRANTSLNWLGYESRSTAVREAVELVQQPRAAAGS